MFTSALSQAELKLNLQYMCHPPAIFLIRSNASISLIIPGTQNDGWIDLHYQQNFNEKNPRVQIFDSSRIRDVQNIQTNKLSVISNQIEYDWLNMPYLMFVSQISKTLWQFKHLKSWK